MSTVDLTGSDLTYGVPDVLRQIRATTSIDDALEHAVAPDRPRRTTREWLDEIGEGLAWTADDLEILDGVHTGMTEEDPRGPAAGLGFPEGGPPRAAEPSTPAPWRAHAARSGLAADLAFPEDGPPSAAELRTLVRWRAQASLIQLASHAARAAATLAEEDALESVAA